MLRYISIDLETTGFSPTANEIIEIGAWKVEDGVATDKFSRLVKPVGYISREIESITGLNSKLLESEEPIETVLPEFFDWCEDYPFLGHNLEFDYNFLCAKGRPLGCDFTLNGMRQGYDTLKLARKYLKNQSHKLEDLVNYFNISADFNYHRAYSDAYATKLIFDRFLLNYPNCSLPEDLSQNKTEYGKVVCNDTLSFT